MYPHNSIYIKCPSCRIWVEIDSQFKYCHVCGGVIDPLGAEDLKHKKT